MSLGVILKPESVPLSGMSAGRLLGWWRSYRSSASRGRQQSVFGGWQHVV